MAVTRTGRPRWGRPAATSPNSSETLTSTRPPRCGRIFEHQELLYNTNVECLHRQASPAMLVDLKVPCHRSVAKTYARQPKRVRDHNEAASMVGTTTKRRRIDRRDDVTSSSPASKSSCPSASTCPSRHTRQTASSDPPSQSDDTPPSSPPPQAIPASMKDGLAQVTSSPREGRRISMSWYQRRRRGALTELTTANAQKPARVKRRPRLTQTHIDLGQGVRTLCKTCGMDYISSNDEDALWHKRFHAMNVGGVDLGRNVSRSLRAKKLWSPDEAAEASEGSTEGFIAVVDKNASLGERQKSKQVLQVVNTELSAVELDDGEDKRTAAAASLGTGDGSDGAKTFLYVKGDKCVGLCLARRISQAHRVSGWKKESGASAVSRSSSVSISHETEPAVLGISRIWTSNSHRRQGIGRRLLECAKDHFVYGMSVPKARIAFSQPTESGGYLAEGWFGGATGWQVYLEG